MAAKAPAHGTPPPISRLRDFRTRPQRPPPGSAVRQFVPSIGTSNGPQAPPPRSFDYPKPIVLAQPTVPVANPGDVRRRVRMHVNPLQAFYLQEVSLPDWSKAFANLSNPIHFDIGFGKGLYLLRLARDLPEWNYLGIDVRLPMVQAALAMQQSAALSNLHFMWGNANVNFARIAASMPAGKLQRVSLLYPDPWFKRRHVKRRMLTPRLVSEMADAIPAGGQLLIETDVKDLADDMWTMVQLPLWREVTDPMAPLMKLDVATERQASVKRYGLRTFRKVFERTEQAAPSAIGGTAVPKTSNT